MPETTLDDNYSIEGMLESFLDANYWKAIMMLITLLETIQGANNSTIMLNTPPEH